MALRRWAPELLEPESRRRRDCRYPWKAAAITCVERVTGLKRKALRSDVVMRSSATEYVDRTYTRCLRIYTDGSFHTENRTATAAFIIPFLNINCHGGSW